MKLMLVRLCYIWNDNSYHVHEMFLFIIFQYMCFSIIYLRWSSTDYIVHRCVPGRSGKGHSHAKSFHGACAHLPGAANTLNPLPLYNLFMSVQYIFAIIYWKFNFLVSLSWKVDSMWNVFKASSFAICSTENYVKPWLFDCSCKM